MLREIVITSVLVVASGTVLAHDRHGHGHGMLGRADANKDGTITREEFLAAREQQFTRFDRNSDNVIDDADRREHAEARASERVAKMRGKLDANGDGKITKDEFLNDSTPLFDQADKDGNGALSTEEVEGFRTAARERAQELRKR